MKTSSAHVPAHFLYTPAREASHPPEETLNREGNSDQRPTVSATHQTELQVSGGSNVSLNTVLSSLEEICQSMPSIYFIARILNLWQITKVTTLENILYTLSFSCYSPRFVVLPTYWGICVVGGGQ